MLRLESSIVGTVAVKGGDSVDEIGRLEKHRERRLAGGLDRQSGRSIFGRTNRGCWNGPAAFSCATFAAVESSKWHGREIDHERLALVGDGIGLAADRGRPRPGDGPFPHPLD
jgi:hypothetical protein